jgi:hypothetical protein
VPSRTNRQIGCGTAPMKVMCWRVTRVLRVGEYESPTIRKRARALDHSAASDQKIHLARVGLPTDDVDLVGRLPLLERIIVG